MLNDERRLDAAERSNNRSAANTTIGVLVLAVLVIALFAWHPWAITSSPNEAAPMSNSGGATNQGSGINQGSAGTTNANAANGAASNGTSGGSAGATGGGQQ
jgi:hypothetical protein